jgi:glyoxylase-like metal-dependent hydrolase (beta-lactamase superfamily II)
LDTTQNYHFRIGALSCTAINDGTEVAALESVFIDAPLESVKQALVERGYPENEALVSFNCLYIQSGAQRILVDAGWGQGVQRRDGALLAGLQDEGVEAADIDLIVITHGDVDHIGGILRSDQQLTFSNAEYVLSREAWDFWNNAAVIARWPEFLTYFGRVTLPLIRERVKVVEAGVEFLPGLRLLGAPGHRPGHSAVEITSAGEQLFHLADVVGHPILMEHPTWHWYADYRTDQAEKDHAQFLNQAVEQQTLVFGSHLPFPGIGRVSKLGDGWRWLPVEAKQAAEASD